MGPHTQQSRAQSWSARVEPEFHAKVPSRAAQQVAIMAAAALAAGRSTTSGRSGVSKLTCRPGPNPVPNPTAATVHEERGRHRCLRCRQAAAQLQSTPVISKIHTPEKE